MANINSIPTKKNAIALMTTSTYSLLFEKLNINDACLNIIYKIITYMSEGLYNMSVIL